MKTLLSVTLAVCAFFVFVAAGTFAIRGVHSNGNTGWLGSDLAGVEGLGVGSGAAVYGHHAAGHYGMLGGSAGVQGASADGQTDGMIGMATNGVKGRSQCTGCTAVYGEGIGASARGVYGVGDSAVQSGVAGRSQFGFAVDGSTLHGTAVYGLIQEGGQGHAGYFQGRVHVNGTLSKSAGSFRIDHPLDPAFRYLSHSFVESPDMKNIYDGVVTLEADGTAVVELPEWFEVLNKDFRYQLTCIGESAPVYIAQKIKDNKFKIAGGYAGMEVSWQVTGSRDDAYARAHPIVVEEPKGPNEAGRFLHPELYGQPVTQRVGYVERPAAAPGR